MAGRDGHIFPRFGGGQGVGSSRIANWAVIGIFLIMAFGAVAAARDFLMPVTMAILLFFVFTPLRRFNERRGIPDGATALLVTVSILITVGVIAYAASVIDVIVQLGRGADGKRGIAEIARSADLLKAGDW